jgi:tetratricopeptide (TPR) repeat protein
MSAALPWLVLAAAALAGPSPQGDELVVKSQRAKQAMAAGRFEEAEALYQELVRALPGNAGMVFNLGLARYSAGRHQQAAGDFATAVKLDPKLGPAWLLLGMSRLKLEDPAGAVGPLERAVTLEPANPIARLELGDALLKLGRPMEAVRHFERLTELTPRDARAWYGLGAAYLALSRAAFERLEATAPESAFWYALLARSRAEQQQFRSAFYFYRQALALRPEFRGLRAALAEIYRQTGREDWAAVELEREKALGAPDCSAEIFDCEFAAGDFRAVLNLASRRDDPEALYWRSRAASALALNAFARLEELGPSAFRHRLAAEAFALQERHAEAVREWREALRLAPDDASLRLELARSLMANQEHEAALEVLDELARLNPGWAEVHRLRGEAWLSLQEPAKAAASLEEALRRDPGSLAARAALGRAYLQIDRPKDAIPHLEAAAETDEDGNLHYLLAQAWLRTGEREKAGTALERRRQIREAAEQRARQREERYRIMPPAP